MIKVVLNKQTILPIKMITIAGEISIPLHAEQPVPGTLNHTYTDNNFTKISKCTLVC